MTYDTGNLTRWMATTIDGENKHEWHRDMHAAADEIERLQEAKRAALKVADERSKENVRLRAAIDFVRNRSARAGEILNEFDATFGVSSNIQ